VRRFARRLFTLCSAASLLLCVMVCVLWARSYWTDDRFSCERVVVAADGRQELRRWSLRSAAGRARLGRHSDRRAFRLKLPRRPLAWDADDDLSWSPGSLGWPPVRVERAGGLTAVETSHWLLLPPLALLPACWLVARRAAATRASAGLCPSCGYDLRATPGRCPECGTAAAGPGDSAG
jgi:hypothetical protein